MSPLLALLICVISVLVLLWTTTQGNTKPSFGSWLVFIWVAVGASRPVTTWFKYGPKEITGADAYDAGNPVERNFYLLLIAIGIGVLVRRRLSIARFLRENPAYSIYCAFWLVSAAWSDMPFVTFRRWFKDSGTIVMILVLLTDPVPFIALRQTIIRCSYVLIPFSIVLIRYFGELGRAYSVHDGTMMNIGVAPQKNTLGILCMVSVLFLVYDLFHPAETTRQHPLTLNRLPRIAVLVASVYLLYLSHSATSIVCTTLGAGVLVIASSARCRALIVRLRYAILFAVPLLILLDSFFDLKSSFLEMVGRDPTLTTRTTVWPLLLQYQTSPLIGFGFMSFWSGDRFAVLLDEFGIFQAHNGYIEVYLNGGVAGLFFLGLFLFSGFRRVFSQLKDLTYASIFIACLFALVLMHNVTEASINTFSPLWLLLVYVSVRPPHTESHIDETDSGSRPTISDPVETQQA